MDDDLVKQLNESFRSWLEDDVCHTAEWKEQAATGMDARLLLLHAAMRGEFKGFKLVPADAIERLCARIAELESGQGLRVEDMNNAQKARYFAQMAKDYIRINGQLNARIWLLESGKPAEIRGQLRQLVPVKPSAQMIEAWSSLALSRLMNPEANKGLVGAVEENWAAMLTASAQEVQEDKT